MIRTCIKSWLKVIYESLCLIQVNTKNSKCVNDNKASKRTRSQNILHSNNVLTWMECLCGTKYCDMIVGVR